MAAYGKRLASTSSTSLGGGRSGERKIGDSDDDAGVGGNAVDSLIGGGDVPGNLQVCE